jgi:hypothetical protein
VEAISEYVFVLSAQFDDFKTREEDAKEKKKKTATPIKKVTLKKKPKPAKKP